MWVKKKKCSHVSAWLRFAEQRPWSGSHYWTSVEAEGGLWPGDLTASLQLPRQAQSPCYQLQFASRNETFIYTPEDKNPEPFLFHPKGNSGTLGRLEFPPWRRGVEGAACTSSPRFICWRILSRGSINSQYVEMWFLQERKGWHGMRGSHSNKQVIIIALSLKPHGCTENDLSTDAEDFSAEGPKS